MDFYGNGSDGDVTFDGTSTILGIVPVASIYSMTRDIYLNNATINADVAIKTSNFRVFAKTSLVNDGTISCDGNDAVNGIGGSALLRGTFGSGGGQGGNSTFSTGNDGASINPGLGGSGGTGGTSSYPSGYSGITVAPPDSDGGTDVLNAYPFCIACVTTSWVQIGGGAGGGGGGGNESNAGGGGGSGAGNVGIFAKNISGDGTISASGGDGASAAVSDSGGGGGGGGGVIVIGSDNDPEGTSLSFIVGGGSGGTGMGTGHNGSTGSPGRIYFV